MKRHLLLACCLLAGAASAEPLAVGDALAPFSLADQHGEARALDPSVSQLLFSRDMDGGGVIREALGDADAAALAERGILYVADISRMPGLVSRLFAIPSMRRRPYPMLLDREGEATADLPSQDGKATRIVLDALRVTGVEYFESSDALAAALGLPAQPEEDAGQD